MALGSVRLRGGYDANPELLPGGRASAFAGVDAAFALGRSYDASSSKAGLTGEIQELHYARGGIAPSERARLALDLEGDAFTDWTLKSSTTGERTRTYNLRSFDAAQSVRAQWTGGALRPFLFAEARYTTLNETNAILTDFLPEDQRFVRATVIPGVTVTAGDGEFGASVNLSVTRYMQEPDLFGYRRNSERIQPYLFYRFDGETLDFSAAISQLRGQWHDVDFSPVRTTLFDVALTWKARGNPWTLDLVARRAAAETSFPISPITISETYSGKLTFAPGEQWSLGMMARWQRTAYLDAPFSSSIVAYGLTGSYAIDRDWSVGAELLRINSSALNGEAVDGGALSFSLTRKFDLRRDASPAGDAGKIIGAAATPSHAQTGSPLKDSMPAPSVSSQAVY